MSHLQNLGGILVKELKSSRNTALVIIEHLYELNNSCGRLDQYNFGILRQHWLSLAFHEKLEPSVLASLHRDSLNE
jgi:hypothetical protein